MSQELSKKETQVLNDIGNIKAILGHFSSVELFNETPENILYNAQVKQLSHVELGKLKKVKLSVWSVFVNNDRTISVKLERRIKV